LDFSEDEFPDELVLRFEPYGKITQFLSAVGDFLDEGYTEQPNEITLRPDTGAYHPRVNDALTINIWALEKDGLLSRIGEFLSLNGEQILSFLILWQDCENIEIEEHFIPGVMRGELVDKEKFDEWVEQRQWQIKNCRTLSNEFDFAGYIANRAKLKLDLNIKHYEKAVQRSQAAKLRRSRKNFSKAEFKKIGERNGYKCMFCGTHQDLELDHIVPFSKGGTDEIENLQLLCKKCNISKGTKSNESAKVKHASETQHKKDREKALTILDELTRSDDTVADKELSIAQKKIQKGASGTQKKDHDEKLAELKSRMKDKGLL
jgi:5-methylcytosine-specific restriction endonuclease McrA